MGKWLDVLKNYAAHDIFKKLWAADEMGLFFKAQPSQTPTLKEKIYTGEKSFTIMVGYNMDRTEKLSLLVIRKVVKPCCFKNVKIYQFPTLAAKIHG